MCRVTNLDDLLTTCLFREWNSAGKEVNDVRLPFLGINVREDAIPAAAVDHSWRKKKESLKLNLN